MSGFNRFRRTKWFRPAVIIGGLLLLALVIPFLVPLRGYLPEVTAIASQKIGQPVTIEDMRLQILPTPRVALYGIKVGKAAPLQIAKLRVVPDVWSLFGEHKAIRLIRADGVRIREAAIAMLGKMPKSKEPKEGAAPVRIDSVELRRVTFEHRAMKVPQFDLRVDLGERYAPVSAIFRTGDRALEARLEPEDKGRMRVTLEARKWTLPFPAAPLVFDSLHASGTLQGSRLELPQVAGELYGGTLAGSVHLDWSRNWRLGGKADIAGVDLLPLLKDLRKPAKLSGRLDAKAVFSSSARTAAQLGRALVLDAPAEVKGGAWHGVDLARAAELPLGKLPEGGKTPFEELRGDVALRGKTIRLEKICARSPTLVAGGRAEVAADQALSGKLDVSVAKTGGIVGVPLALGGTVSAPSIGLTRGATIGAVLGTLLMPGVGTTIGATAGGKLEGGSGCE
jgi:AsmA family